MPVCTKLEETDISAGGGMSGQTCLTIQKAAIDFIGESRSDYDIGCAVAKKLEEFGGQYEGLYNKYTGGKSLDEWLKFAYENSGCANDITWEELNEKQYYCPEVDLDRWENSTFCLTPFYHDPEANPVGTPSGKLEFYSDRLAQNFPEDNERPPYPQWIEGGPVSDGWTHDERVTGTGERCDNYPLLLVSNHPRWRNHVQLDNLPWLREIPTMKIKGYDGYMYEPVWINPVDAEARGIQHHDIVKLYNERGIVLAAAYVTGRIKPGALSQDHGAGVDLITDKIDRGGSNNLISPEKGLSKNCWGQATTSFLVEVEKLDPAEMEEWRKQYPEAFSRSYDPAFGVLPNSWIEGGSW
jgi:trimethylamine-N-oxide reductase (cytochrome c)